VSLRCDGLGFDIAVHAAGSVQHLEVKSTNRLHRLTFYLSRNEFEVMRRDDHWALVAVTLSEQLVLQSVRTISNEWIAACAPTDASAGGGAWQVCKFEVPPEAILDGVRSLAPALLEGAPAVLRGDGDGGR
jgi:hypothetical protein